MPDLWAETVSPVILSIHAWLSRLRNAKKVIVSLALFTASVVLLRSHYDILALQSLQLPSTSLYSHNNVPEQGQNMKGRILRILPLGDSITEGFASSTGDGYRAVLEHVLITHGNTLTLVGSRKSGAMLHNSHDGWGGFAISNIALMRGAWVMRPNVVLLMAGINDAAHNDDIPNAAQKLDDLVGALFEACPDTTILIAKLLPCLRPVAEANARIINAELTPLIKKRTQEGQHILLVDLSTGFDVNVDLADDLHPNDVGYDWIAHGWANALDEADAAGWIGTPVDAPNKPDDYVFPWT